MQEIYPRVFELALFLNQFPVPSEALPSVVGRFSRVLMSLVAELFEGDIIMDQRLRSWVTGQYDKRDAINDDSYLWPSSLDENGERVIRVPYTLSDEIKRGKRRSSLFSLVLS